MRTKPILLLLCCLFVGFSARAGEARGTHSPALLGGLVTTAGGQQVENRPLQLRNLATREIIGTTTSGPLGTFGFSVDVTDDIEVSVELLDANGFVISATQAFTLSPGTNLTQIPVRVEPTCKVTTGFQPTSDTIDFSGCIGFGSYTSGTSPNVSIFKTDAGNPPLLEIFITRVEFSAATGAGSFEFPFKFTAVDVASINFQNWVNGCLADRGTTANCPNRPFVPAPDAERIIQVNVTPVDPSPAISHTMGSGVFLNIRLAINTRAGCGPIGLSPCSYPVEIPVAPFSNFAQAHGPAPIAPGQVLTTDTVVCNKFGFSTFLPAVIGELISPFDILFCLPQAWSAPPDGFGFRTKVTGRSATVTGTDGTADPSLGFTGAPISLFLKPLDAITKPSVRFSTFNYFPQTNNNFQFKFQANGSVFAEAPVWTTTSGATPYISSPFPLPDMSLFGILPLLQGTQRTFIDIPVTTGKFGGSAVVTDYQPQVVDPAGQVVHVTGRGFSTITFNGVSLPGTGVSRVTYGDRDQLFSIVSDTELIVTLDDSHPTTIPLDGGPFRPATLKLETWGQPIEKPLMISKFLMVAVDPNLAMSSAGGQLVRLQFPYGAPGTLTNVWFGGVPATFAKCDAATVAPMCAGAFAGSGEWVAIAPPHAPGRVHVGARAACDGTLAAPRVCGTSLLMDADEVTYQTSPQLLSLSRATGPPAGGEQITLQGSGFIGLATVTFGSSIMSICNSASCGAASPSATSLVVTVPAGSGGSVARVGLEISCPNPGGSCGQTQLLNYSYLGVPVVTTVSPSHGTFAGGTPVVITGHGFTTATSVLFEGAVAPFNFASPSFTIVSDTEIHTVAPVGYPGIVSALPGTAQVSVIVNCGAGFLTATSCGASNRIDFVYDPLATRLTTALTTIPVYGASGDPDLAQTTLRATLMAGGNPVAGRAVTFTVLGTTAGSAITNASGVATLSPVAVNGPPQTNYRTGIVASFVGDLAYTAATATAPVTLTGSEVAVFGTSPPAVPSLGNVRAIAAGRQHLLVVKNDGRVIGYGSTAHVPAGLTNVIAVAAAKSGVDMSAAVKADGTVVVWNDGGVAQCPSCSNLKSVSISTDRRIALGLTTAGRVVGWGDAASDTGGILNIPAAAQSHIVAISAGSQHALALTDSGTFVQWGGDFVQAVISDVIIAVSAGLSGHSLALLQDGSLVQWGVGRALPSSIAAQHFVAVDLGGDQFKPAFGTTHPGHVWKWSDQNPTAQFFLGAVDPEPAAISSGSSWAAVQSPPRVPLTVTVDDVTGLRGESKTLRATVVSGDAPAPGVTVSFALYGIPVGDVVTDASGIATVQTVIPLFVGGGSYPDGVQAVVNTQEGFLLSIGYGLLTVPRPSQTISFGALPAKAFQEGPITVDASASSGRLVAITAGGNCSAAGNVISFVHVGPCTVTASQAGDADVEPAIPVSQTFQILQSGQTITFDPIANKTYGDGAVVLTASATSGFPVSFSVVSGPAFVAGPTVTITGAGPVVIRASQAGNANFAAAAPVDRSFTVARAPLTITARDEHRQYKTANPVFGGTVSGVVPGEVIQVTYSSIATVLSPAGAYPIIPMVTLFASAPLENYNITTTIGTLTIDPQPLTITTNPASQVYGDATPIFSGTVSDSTGQQMGVKNLYYVNLDNGDVARVMYSTTATAASPVGTYPIAAALVDVQQFPWDGSKVVTGSYGVMSIGAMLSLVPRSLTVTADNAKRGTGRPNPSFTGTISGLVNDDWTLVSATYGSAADASSPAGTYPIVPTIDDGQSGALDNYTVVAVNGLLTVVRLPAIPVAGAPNHVVAWGDNSFGQTNVPAAAVNVVSIAAAGSHSVALAGDGTVYEWGNVNGGNPDFIGHQPTTKPLEFWEPTVPGAAQPVSVSAGRYHSIALMSDGTIRGWGRNDQFAWWPFQTPALTDVFAVSAGFVPVAIMSDGSVVSWLQRFNGAASGTPAFELVPAPASGAPLPVAVVSSIQDPRETSGGSFAILLSDGSVNAYSYSVRLDYDPTPAIEGYVWFVTIDSVGHADGPFASLNEYLGLTPNAPPGLVGIQAFARGDAHTTAIVLDGARQTITFDPIADQHYRAPFTVTATATSGLPVTFSASGVCGVVPDPSTLATTVMPVGIGTCTLTASQQGNSYTGPADDVVLDVTILKGVQTITIGPIGNKTVGDPAFALPALSSGSLYLSFSVVSGPATVDGNIVSIGGAGTVVLRASQSGDAYYFAADDLDLSFEVTEPVSVKQQQTIAFDPLGDRTYGDGPITLNAYASSGLPVRFTASGGCSVVQDVLTIATAGECVVMAAQDGDESFAAAPNVSLTFAIARAGQMITFAPIANHSPTDAPFVITATTTSPLTVVLTAIGTCSVTGDVVTILGAGQCTIIADQPGDANYFPASGMAQAFLIAAPSVKQTIVFRAIHNHKVTDAPFAITATASSGLPVTFTASGACSVVNGMATLSAVGTCTITASQPGDATYLAAPDVSRTFTITLGSQKITFATIATHKTTDAPFALTATASSGLPVTFAAGGQCSVADGLVSIIGEGSCTITASQSGDTTYAPAPDVARTFAIVRATQKITFAAIAKHKTTDAPFAITATASSGLPVTFAASGQCSVTDGLVTIGGEGTCAITASQAGDATYLAAPDVTRTFTIIRAPQTITFGAIAVHKTTDAPFAVSATASSGLPVTFAASGACSVADAIVTITGAGSCTITASQSGDATYAPAPDVARTFTIKLAPQTITFAAIPKHKATDAPFAVTATASSGLQVILAATGACTVANSIVTISGAGTCSIVASQPGDATYATAPNVTRTFTIGL